MAPENDNQTKRRARTPTLVNDENNNQTKRRARTPTPVNNDNMIALTRRKTKHKEMTTNSGTNDDTRKEN
ncbi:14077_t:CDS:2 [Gigaspora margarita]|uniref:14077_t:CDS:1 n=1 Tax=Gigaspora margarita TaxID=4874 RepID=A0ABN7WMR7_GIGMA|nr:14077_t:CDS:2 [Gigaspora margarita]